MSIVQKNLYCRNLNTSYLEGLPEGEARGIYFFIHGCPDDATIWAKLMERFQNEGLIVLAPFLRGIDKSEAPLAKDSGRYTPEAVTLDHLEVLAQYDSSLPVTVICHDMGSVSGWELARQLGKRLNRLVAINSPDSLTLLKQFRKTSQIKKSWYIGLIQTGKIAEMVFKGFKKPLMSKNLIKGNYPELDDEKINKAIEDFPKFLPHYREAFVDVPKRLMLKVASSVKLAPEAHLIESPMLLWGIHDPFLNIPTAKDLSTVATKPEIRVLEGGHWLPLEKEDDVFRLIKKSVP